MTADRGPRPAVVGAILAGGRSARFGSDKALAPAGDKLVGQRVIEAVRAAGADPVVTVGGNAGDHLGVPTIPDLRPGDGPLAGLATALLWAKTGLVIVVPCDLPLLGGPDLQPLVEVARSEPERAVVAMVDDRPQVSVAVWPAVCGRSILKSVDDGRRAFRAALDIVEWTGIDVAADAVRDADTPQELARLLANRDR